MTSSSRRFGPSELDRGSRSSCQLSDALECVHGFGAIRVFTRIAARHDARRLGVTTLSLPWLAISWIVTIALSYFALGAALARAVEGIHPSGLPWFAMALFGVSFAMSIVLTWRRAFRTRPDTKGSDLSGRRRFLLGAAGSFGGVIATMSAAVLRIAPWYEVTARNIFLVRPRYKADAALPEWAGARVVEYRRLGRTEARVSDISLGSGSSTGGRQTLEVVREAIERGINYFDTAPDYSGAGSEKRFGEAMKGVRDQIFLATKFCTPAGHIPPGSPVNAYIQAIESSLQRLRTDRVDLVHIHSCDSVQRLLDENAHEAFDRLREQGKVRFLGVSTHTPNLEEVANAAIDSDRFDVMMLAYHYGAWPTLGEIIDRAAARDIGVVAMKTLRGGMHQRLDWSRPERDSFTQASFKWVLSNPSVSCLVISLWESGQLDEFLYASGQQPDTGDLAVLERYRELTTAEYCRPHCGACLESCPEGLPVNDVLRQRMYFEEFGAQKEAMRLYGRLQTNASVCIGCAAPCANSCPHGLDIPRRTQESHRLLMLS